MRGTSRLGRPYVKLANVEGPFGHKLAPPRAVLREGDPFGEGERGAARARLSKVLEVALERPAVGRLLASQRFLTLSVGPRNLSLRFLGPGTS